MKPGFERGFKKIKVNMCRMIKETTNASTLVKRAQVYFLSEEFIEVCRLQNVDIFLGVLFLLLRDSGEVIANSAFTATQSVELLKVSCEKFIKHSSLYFIPSSEQSNEALTRPLRRCLFAGFFLKLCIENSRPCNIYSSNSST